MTGPNMRRWLPRSRRLCDPRLIGVALLLAGCASADSGGPAELLAPRFRVRLISGQILPSAYTPSTDVELRVDIYNDSGEPITLKRLQLQSVMGGFAFRPVGKIFNRIIPSKGVETFELWVTAFREAASVDVRGPVTVRGTAVFDSPAGAFRRVFTADLVESRPGGPE